MKRIKNEFIGGLKSNMHFDPPKVTRQEVFKAFGQNYLYGFTGVMIPVAVWMEHTIILAVALFAFYSMLSIVVNREKYVTNLGKYFLFPLPAMLGGVSAYVLGDIIKSFI